MRRAAKVSSNFRVERGNQRGNERQRVDVWGRAEEEREA